MRQKVTDVAAAVRCARIAELAVCYRAQKYGHVVLVLQRWRDQEHGVVPATAVQLGDLLRQVELVCREWLKVLVLHTSK